jgi:hypothetical protein
LAGKKSGGTPLKLFSGREEALNRLILQILQSAKQPLITYDMALQVNRVKEFKHTDKNTVYRRMDALDQQDMISVVGQRPTKPGWPSELYAINPRGLAALKLDKKHIEEFLQTASYDELCKFNDAYP